jgi:hypothetical protein
MLAAAVIPDTAVAPPWRTTAMDEREVIGLCSAGADARKREVWDPPRIVSTALKDTGKLLFHDEPAVNDDPAPGPS